MSSQASPPFNKQTADIVLRSVDGVDFRVHKAILAEATPVFEAMFGLPQPPTESFEAVDGVPILHFTEPSRTLDLLLRIIYPIPDPAFADPEDAGLVFEAARKYDMEEAMSITQKSLLAFADADPFVVYAIAYCLRLREVTCAAAKATLRFSAPPGTETPAVLWRLPAAPYHALLVYRSRADEFARRFAAEAAFWLEQEDPRILLTYHICLQRGSELGGHHVQNYVPNAPFDLQAYQADLAQLLAEKACGDSEVWQILFSNTRVRLAAHKDPCSKCRAEKFERLKACHQDVQQRFTARLSEVEIELDF